jgi:transcriptional regulator with XRE-family HTH domain
MSLNVKEKIELGERISRLIAEKEGGNSRQFALKIGMDPSQLAKVEKGTVGLSYKMADRIASVYGVDVEYIMKGQQLNAGDNFENILNDTEGKMSYVFARRTIKNAERAKKTIPFYDAEAVAGITETEMTPIHAPAGTIDIGDLLNDSQAAIRIYGNSMLPNYPPGCVVGLVKCNKSFIEPGEVYVIETRDRRLLKRLFYKNDDTDNPYVTCYSDNIMKFEGGSRNGKLAYPPFDMPKEEIINLYVVTGVIKRNANSVIINR